MIAAAATYYAGRWAGRGALHARAGGRMARLDGWLNRRGLSAVLLVRFLPLAPFGLIGYAYGTTTSAASATCSAPRSPSIPSAVSYAVIGAAVASPGSNEPADPAPRRHRLHPDDHHRVRWRRTARRAALAAA